MWTVLQDFAFGHLWLWTPLIWGSQPKVKRMSLFLRVAARSAWLKAGASTAVCLPRCVSQVLETSAGTHTEWRSATRVSWIIPLTTWWHTTGRTTGKVANTARWLWRQSTSSICSPCTYFDLHSGAYVITGYSRRPTVTRCARCRFGLVKLPYPSIGRRSHIADLRWERLADRLFSALQMQVQAIEILEPSHAPPKTVHLSRTAHIWFIPPHSLSKLISWRKALIVPICDSFSVSKIAFRWLPNRFYRIDSFVVTAIRVCSIQLLMHIKD